MSQAKVDQYKKEKANRKQTMAKDKTKSMISKICATVIGAALAVWIAWSAVVFVIESRPVKTIFTKNDAVESYLEELYKEETESSTDSQSTESSTTETTKSTEATE